ncbi:MAG TPA: hypothetical protein VM469_15295 [Pseudoxanthomonas sp.]|nr:hypothetical protein [Pseudoxanthomonas sp.]
MLLIAALGWLVGFANPSHAAVATGTGSVDEMLQLAERVDDDTSAFLRLAALRIADGQANARGDIDEVRRAELRRRRVNEEIAQGRAADALPLLPATPESWPALLQAFTLEERRQVAAAYAVQADLPRARMWLATADQMEPVGEHERGEEANDRRRRNLQLALLQRLLDRPERDDFLLLTQHYNGDPFDRGAPVWTQAFNQLAMAQGYPGLVQPVPYVLMTGAEAHALSQCQPCTVPLQNMIHALAESAPAPDLAAEEAAQDLAEGPPLPEVVRQRMAQVLASPRPGWQEHEVPRDLRSERVTVPARQSRFDRSARSRLFAPDSSPEAPAPPWEHRLPEGRLVRYAQQGQRIVAITASQTLDPTGEISAGGYWISVSDDGGLHFAPPLYTGLRMYEPYVVLPDSRLPLLDGDRLRVEVAVRQLDRDHISLPPITLPLLEQRDHLYLETDLTELRRDSDGDGLTDLAEWGMLLAPDLSDTDGDGRGDGEDPLPHIAASTAIPGGAALAAGLNEIFGESLGAVVTSNARDNQPGRRYAMGGDTDAYHADRSQFMAGPSASFAGLSLKHRVIVLAKEQRVQMSQARGVQFVMGVSRFQLSHDGTMALMVWSTGWAGGTLRLTRVGDSWQVERLGGWIT